MDQKAVNPFELTLFGKAVHVDVFGRGSERIARARYQSEMEALRMLMPGPGPVEVFSMMYDPEGKDHPMDWLGAWCEEHGLTLISEAPLKVDGRLLVWVQGEGPLADLPECLVPVKVEFNME